MCAEQSWRACVLQEQSAGVETPPAAHVGFLREPDTEPVRGVAGQPGQPARECQAGPPAQVGLPLRVQVSPPSTVLSGSDTVWPWFREGALRKWSVWSSWRGGGRVGQHQTAGSLQVLGSSPQAAQQPCSRGLPQGPA